jgi:hypothetical protein
MKGTMLLFKLYFRLEDCLTIEELEYDELNPFFRFSEQHPEVKEQCRLLNRVIYGAPECPNVTYQSKTG